MPSPAGVTLFERMDPWELEHELQRAAREITEELKASAGFIRTGLKLVDYLVDQRRFVKAGLAQAERRGLKGVPALEWVEYLSWPECSRQAKPGWRRDLLKRLAFEEPVGLWQRALWARHPGDEVGTGPPRRAIFPPPAIQLGPYPSHRHPTRQATACLEANIYFDPASGYPVKPGPLRPVRRLDELHSWSLVATATVLYNGWFRSIQVLVDEPRTYSVGEARAVLLTQADRGQGVLDAARGATPAISEEAAAQLAGQTAFLRAAAEQIGQVNTRGRARMLEYLFSLPGTLLMTAVEALTDDLPPEWLGVLLGFAFERKELVSVRERRQFRKAAASVLGHWQASRYPHREIAPEAAERLVERLSGVRRPLQPKSVFAYLAKLVRAHRARRRKRNQQAVIPG